MARFTSLVFTLLVASITAVSALPNPVPTHVTPSSTYEIPTPTPDYPDPTPTTYPPPPPTYPPPPPTYPPPPDYPPPPTYPPPPPTYPPPPDYPPPPPTYPPPPPPTYPPPDYSQPCTNCVSSPNNCDITAPCSSFGGSLFCGCRPGYKASYVQDDNTNLQWRIDVLVGHEHRVWVAPGVVCDTLCESPFGTNPCGEVAVADQCFVGTYPDPPSYKFVPIKN